MTYPRGRCALYARLRTIAECDMT